MDYPKLLAPGKINHLELKNRVVMTAMGVGLANHDGTASAKTLQYFKERAEGGVGLIITEYTRINEKDAIVSGEQLAMSQPKHVQAFQKVVKAVHQAGAKIFVQLHHPGRENVPLFPAVWPTSNRLAKIIPGYWRFFGKVMGNNDRSSLTDPRYYQFMNRFMKPLRAPSDVPAGLGFSPFGNFKIKPLTIAEIHDIETQFVAAAKRVQASGADGVELHAGHGYLLNQFLSPYTNIRTDDYGGNTENRARIVKEIIAGIRQHLGPNFPISVRLTVNEFYDKIGYPGQGITLAEGVKLAKLIEAYGADALNVTIANSDTQVLISEPVSYPLGWRQPLVKAIKAAVKIPVIAVGVIRTPQQAEEILKSGNQDFIGLARPLLADPLWVKKAEANTPQLINRCIGCLVCQESYEAGMLSGEPAICTVNPRAGHETEIPINAVKDGQKRPVVIIGAGPAGLTAARELALRDFEVTILEQSASTGGQVKLAERPPHKEKIAWSYLDLEAQARQAGVKIRLNTAASSELLKSYHPYAVLIATGGSAFKPNIPGATQDFVYTTTPILQGKVTFHNQKIVVVGSGMTGLETSELLVQQHNQVTIVEMADQIAPGVFAPNVWDVTERLKAGNVRYLTGRKLVAINDHTVTLIQQNHVRELLQADAVVLSLGVRHNVPLAKSWAGLVSKLVVIGDANRIGRIKDAIHAGFKAARNL
ncbi:2-enoate reductase [Agrilactobacillus composti DSM 18527 = JCM 14202]|uniref:2-enoate reductase n=1 Tax=Agrilactobacillus composti DSM 18527 = JCM 14202 TaxID=1423734 RepID=X0PLT4_9LACO|nr:NAD(P)/FAD-dependent oxidoreductase [Agrilactobacillus composti]KRM30527.1 2-enoate reductase [Agrilactobacillus composti DSM 18527 = JCM 14202]GAF38407.1 2,4-dienoyl-CoA reductase [Agrilactobacillus composti DSM 18527 = JCM 14202]